MSRKGTQSKSARSAVIIARLLSSEGFTEHTASEITRYYLHGTGLSERQKRQFWRLKKEIGAMCLKLTEGEKQVLGKFISMHKNLSFDCGLRIGMTAFAVANDKPADTIGMEPDGQNANHDEGSTGQRKNYPSKRVARRVRVRQRQADLQGRPAGDAGQQPVDPK